MQCLGQRGVDLDADGPVRKDVGFQFHHHLGWILLHRPPPGRGTHAAHPVLVAGVPVVVVGEPPVAVAEAPVPGRDRKPVLLVTCPQDLDLDRRLGHRGTEVVAGIHLRRDNLPKHHRLGGSIDRDFKLGFLVLLDAETAPATDTPGMKTDLVHSQRGIAR